MSVWFTSDLHLGHRLVAQLRGFDSPEEHDAAILDAWAKRVGKNDQVWVLGDIAVSNPVKALEQIAELTGIKHLIAGNHDSCHPMHRDSHKWQPRYLTTFASVQAFARRRVNGKPVMLSHFPYTVDRGIEIRYPGYRLTDCGVPLLHGHTHLTERITSDHEIHVGLDAWSLRPVHLSEIEPILAPNHATGEQ